jgi:hypothetical protein
MFGRFFLSFLMLIRPLFFVQFCNTRGVRYYYLVQLPNSVLGIRAVLLPQLFSSEDEHELDLNQNSFDAAKILNQPLCM